MKGNFLAKLGNKMGRTGLKLKKHSPDILFVGGMGLTIGGVIVACKATPKCTALLQKHKENMAEVDACRKLAIEHPEENEYTVADQKKDTWLFRRDLAIGMIKTYALPAAMITGGLVCIGKSNRIFKKRYLGAAAAFAADHKELKAIKDRIFKEMGPDRGRAFLYGAKDIDFVDIQTEQLDEDGNPITVTKPMNDVIDADTFSGVSQYAKYFDKKCKAWDPSPTHSLAYLKQVQSSLTDILLTRGHLFLNEVYDALGMPHTSDGAIVGWVKGMGDDFVDFGVYNANLAVNRDFVNGYENICLLDFNVDGIIYDLI